MSEPLPVLPFVIMGGLVLLIIVLLVFFSGAGKRRHQKRKEALSSLAKALGWADKGSPKPIHFVFGLPTEKPWEGEIHFVWDENDLNDATAVQVSLSFSFPETLADFAVETHPKEFSDRLVALLSSKAALRVGDPDFEEIFVLKGDDENKARQFLHADLRHLLKAEAKERKLLHLKAKDGSLTVEMRETDVILFLLEQKDQEKHFGDWVSVGEEVADAYHAACQAS